MAKSSNHMSGTVKCGLTEFGEAHKHAQQKLARDNKLEQLKLQYPNESQKIIDEYLKFVASTDRKHKRLLILEQVIGIGMVIILGIAIIMLLHGACF